MQPKKCQGSWGKTQEDRAGDTVISIRPSGWLPADTSKKTTGLDAMFTNMS